MDVDFQLDPTSTGIDPTTGLPKYNASAQVPANGGVSKLIAGATAAVADCGKLLSFTLSGAATYTLPATPPAVPDGGGTERWKISLKNQAASTAALTISATSPAKLDGTTAGSLNLLASEGVNLWTDGTDYFTGQPPVNIAGVATQAGVQQQSYTYAADTGSANAYAVSLTPAPTIGAGSVVVFKAANANTGTSTLAVNGGSATPIKKEGSVALIAGDIAAGQIVCVVNDGTNWQMFGVPALPVGSSTQQGILQVDGTSLTASGGVASATGAPVIKGVFTSNTASAARTSSGSLSAAFGSSVKPGNAILVIAYATSASPVPTDGVNTYVAITPNEIGSFINMRVYLAVNVAGGTTTISTTTSGLGAFYAWELQNIVGVSGFDAFGLTQTGSGAPLAITASATTTNPSDYMLGIDLAQITTVSGTWNSPYTSRTATGSDVNGVNIFMGDANVTSAGSQSVTFNASVTTGSHSLFLIGLKVATGVTDFNGQVGHTFGVSSLTTSGSSGPATYNPATGGLNVPEYSLAPGVYAPSLLSKPPAIGGWTWVNQGSATDDNNNGFIYINAPASSSFSLRMLSLPLTGGTTFTFRATLRAMFPQLVSSQSYAIGIGLRESSSGKVIMMYYASFGTGGTLRIGVNKYTSPTVFSSNLKDVAAPQFVGNISFQIQQDGTNRLFAWGDDDGGHFPIALVQEAQSTFMTPDQVVLVADSENSASNAAVLLNGMTLTYP